MKGIPYKDTFAAKGSELYDALTAGDQALAKRIYNFTTARHKAMMQGVPPPTEHVDEKTQKVSIIWHDGTTYKT